MKNCRICEKDSFSTILDLGEMPLVDNFPNEDSLGQEKTYPLKLIICESCKLVQLSYVVPPEEMFHSDYAYDMSVTDSGVKHFHQMAEDIDIYYPDHNSVLDIGSNTGVLLEGFKEQGWNILGVEPSRNVCSIAREKGIPTKNDFFSESLAKKILSQEGPKDVVTATNVFAHVDNLQEFMKGVKTILSQDGVFIIEIPYLIDLVKNNEFDTIYHEHLSYFSIKPLQQLFKQHSMEVIDIERQEIHGGSLRIHIANKGEHELTDAVEQYQKKEEETGINTRKTLEAFQSRVVDNRRKLTDLIHELHVDGKTIAGAGAPAKGVTLLNYCNFDSHIIPYVSERSEIKIGKFIPGTHNEVVSDETLLDRKPDYVLLLPWNFSESIIENLRKYLEVGGKFIVPVPEPHIIDLESWESRS